MGLKQVEFEAKLLACRRRKPQIHRKFDRMSSVRVIFVDADKNLERPYAN